MSLYEEAVDYELKEVFTVSVDAPRISDVFFLQF